MPVIGGTFSIKMILEKLTRSVVIPRRQWLQIQKVVHDADPDRLLVALREQVASAEFFVTA